MSWRGNAHAQESRFLVSLKEKVHYNWCSYHLRTSSNHDPRHGIKGGADGTEWRTQPTRFEKTKMASMNSIAVIRVL